MSESNGNENKNVLIEVIERFVAEVIVDARTRMERDDMPTMDVFTALHVVRDRWRKAGECE